MLCLPIVSFRSFVMQYAIIISNVYTRKASIRPNVLLSTLFHWERTKCREKTIWYVVSYEYFFVFLFRQLLRNTFAVVKLGFIVLLSLPSLFGLLSLDVKMAVHQFTCATRAHLSKCLHFPNCYVDSIALICSSKQSKYYNTFFSFRFFLSLSLWNAKAKNSTMRRTLHNSTL